MWDLPGPGIEPVSPALVGGFLTTVPVGKSLLKYFYEKHITDKFFFNDTATTEIYTLSLHDALPIYALIFLTYFFGCIGSLLLHVGFL